MLGAHPSNVGVQQSKWLLTKVPLGTKNVSNVKYTWGMRLYYKDVLPALN